MFALGGMTTLYEEHLREQREAERAAGDRAALREYDERLRSAKLQLLAWLAAMVMAAVVTLTLVGLLRR